MTMERTSAASVQTRAAVTRVDTPAGAARHAAYTGGASMGSH